MCLCQSWLTGQWLSAGKVGLEDERLSQQTMFMESRGQPCPPGFVEDKGEGALSEGISFSNFQNGCQKKHTLPPSPTAEAPSGPEL